MGPGCRIDLSRNSGSRAGCRGGGGEGEGGDHVLLVDGHEEFDESIIEIFIIMMSRLFHEVEEMVDESFVKGFEMRRYEFLNTTNLV